VGKRVHPVVAALSLAVVLALAAVIYSRRLQTPPPVRISGEDMVRMQAEAEAAMARRRGGAESEFPGATGLGVELALSDTPPGLKVVSIQEASPLQAIGVEAGDVITACNGTSTPLLPSIVQAMKDLQAKGVAVSLEVTRAGKGITLARSRKLPPAAAARLAAPAKAAARSPGSPPAAEPGHAR
jgi:S1-C subfamily serine protease